MKLCWHLFCKNGKKLFESSNTYCIENYVDSFYFCWQRDHLGNLSEYNKNRDKHEIPIILDQFHNGKSNRYRDINKTIQRIKETYTWYGVRKGVDNFMKNCQKCQKSKSYRRNLDNPLVITKTPKTPTEIINIDILEVPNRNQTLTIFDELTKFSQAYALNNKSVQTVANTLQSTSPTLRNAFPRTLRLW